MVRARAAMTFQQGGRQALCTFGILDLAVYEGAYQVAAQHIATSWGNEVSVCQSNQTALVKVVVEDDNGVQGEWGGVITGQSTDAPMAINSALLVKKLTNGNRRGRMYVPGILETQVGAAGEVLGAALPAWAGCLAGFLADVAAGGIQMTVRSKDPGGLPIDLLITGLAPQTILGTQRRRMRK